MERPKTNGNISKKYSASLNIKLETECASESSEVSNQYARANTSISTTSNDRRISQELVDNNGQSYNRTRENYSLSGEGEPTSCGPEHLFSNGLGNKTNKIKQIIEAAISPESKQTVSKILDQVNQLSVAEKLLLYLKLPTGRSQVTDPLRQPLNPLGSRFEIHQTITWIKTHLEEDQDISLPKQDVYDEYIAYCDSIEMKPLSTADFGKVMKQVFPRVRPRRLGTRGNSRYCYAGMRKRVHLDAPLLPDLGETVANHRTEDETLSAASCLIREWAEKLLTVKFDNLQDLACHLVGNLCVDSRSVAAFTLMSTLEPRKYFSEKDVIPLLLPPGGQANKHRETQLQLQRKLQEREIIREQKRKLQDHQSSASRSNMADKPRVKRPKLSQQVDETSTSVPIVAKHSRTRSTDPTPDNSQENKTLPLPQLTPLPFPWQKNNCDIQTVDMSTQSGQHSKPKQFQNGPTEYGSLVVCKEEMCDQGLEGLSGSKINILETSESGFRPDVPNNYETSEVGQRGQVLNKAESQTLNDFQSLKDVPNKSKNVSRSPGGNVKSRHLSLDFEPNLAHTKHSGRNSATGNFDCDQNHLGDSASDKQKSSLRYYLESLPAKKPRRVPPVHDLSKEFTPNLFRRTQSTDASHQRLPGPPMTGKCSPPPAKLPIPRLANPNKKLPTTTASLIILPTVPVMPKSPRNKYKPIQPKVESPPERDDADVGAPRLGKEGSAFVPPKSLATTVTKDRSNHGRGEGKFVPRKSKCRSNGPTQTPKADGNPPAYGAGAIVVGDLAQTVEPTDARARLGLPPRVRGEVSIGCLEKDALDDYLHGGGNSQEQEEELMQYFQQDAREAPVEASARPAVKPVPRDKLSQLRLLLERDPSSDPVVSSASVEDLVPRPTDHAAPLGPGVPGRYCRLQDRLDRPVLPSPLHGAEFPSSVLGTRRRVSFETWPDRPENSVPPSPNTRRRTFNFTPITPGPHSPLGRISSKPSSADASPFVSPGNTPVPRSKQNCGQGNLQSSFVASANNGVQNRPQPLSLGVVSTYSVNARPGQRNPNMGTYTGQKFTSRSNSLTLGSSLANSLNHLVATRALSQNASNLGQGNVVDSFLGSISREKSRQNAKLQRSQSVNSNTAMALQYLLQQPMAPLFASDNHVQTDPESKMFAIPEELNSNGRNVYFSRPPQVSLSAPQSPLVHFHPNADSFDFKTRDDPFGSNLLEGILKQQSRPDLSGFLGLENNIMNLKSIDRSGAVDEGSCMTTEPGAEDESSAGSVDLRSHKLDTPSQEVGRFFPDEAAENAFHRTVPNFAQLQFRSRSVPLRRTAAPVSPLASRNCFDFGFSSDADSVAPTPVPSEFQDFDSDMLLDSETAVQDGLNLNQIFDILDAEDEGRVRMGLEMDRTREPSEGSNVLLAEQNIDLENGGNLDGNIILPEIKLENLTQNYRDSLLLSMGDPRHDYKMVAAEPVTARRPPDFDAVQDESCSLDMKPEMDFDRQSFPNHPLPYTSTVEYVTDTSLGTFTLNAVDLRSVDDNAYLRDQLMNVGLPLLRGEDNISQLEQEVNKL